MSATWGDNIKISIFGESHGKAIGIIIDGLAGGIELDIDAIAEEMRRRAPGTSDITTPRCEKDEFEIVSGFFNGYTTGTPLTCLIYNKNQHSKDYESIRYVMRPGHADFTGFIKYNGFSDYRGGGHFSGRITAPLVFAGAIAKQILAKKNIQIASHISSIAGIKDRDFNSKDYNITKFEQLRNKRLPVLTEGTEELFIQEILQAKENNNSVGGIVETVVSNIKAGIGCPFFDSVESKLAHLLFSIPAVKGVEFGAGFNISSMNGKDANDEIYYEDGVVKTYTNNNGGIVGGITNGMPVTFKVAFKPTPSIGMKQRTIDIKSMQNTEAETKGRHDPCIIPRAIPVVESVTAIAMLDLIIESEGLEWMNQTEQE